MKKVVFITVVAAFSAALFFTSCKKASNPTGIYTCICNYTVGGTATTNDTSFVSPSEAKSSAQTECNQAASAWTTLGATGVSCSLH